MGGKSWFSLNEHELAALIIAHTNRRTQARRRLSLLSLVRLNWAPIPWAAIGLLAQSVVAFSSQVRAKSDSEQFHLRHSGGQSVASALFSRRQPRMLFGSVRICTDLHGSANTCWRCYSATAAQQRWFSSTDLIETIITNCFVVDWHYIQIFYTLVYISIDFILWEIHHTKCVHILPQKTA